MKFALISKDENEKAKAIYQKVVNYLKSKDQQILSNDNLKSTDYIITLGGDGTLIHTACNYAHLNIPFVGINTGNLGFLTAAEAPDWQKALDSLIRGKVFLSERITLEAYIEPKTRNQKPETIFRGINEAAIKGFLRIAELKVEVNGEKFLKILGDGVIIATQTGSTAYSLSSGGPIVDPDLDCFSLTPINPVGLPIPSVILSPKDEIRVKVINGYDVSLIIDGQESVKLKDGQEVKIKRGKYNIKLAYFDKHHFLRALNSKFGLAKRSTAP